MTPPRIIYEDEAIAVLEKPAACSSESDIPAALRALWGEAGAYVGVVHRLDFGVSGLMVYARTPAAAAALSRQLQQSRQAYAAGESDAKPQFIKCYRAVIAGAPGADLPREGTLRDLLFKDGRSGRVYVVSRLRRGVKAAELEYRVLSTARAGEGEASLAEITLHTGRTHQIRVQFASRRHPLWGDGKYGSRQKGQLALQSCGLSFAHPLTGQPLRFELSAPQSEPWALFAGETAPR